MTPTSPTPAQSKNSGRKPHYDLATIKAAAIGRTLDILADVAKIPREYLSDKEGPCPKCGGNTRARVVDREAGAFRCSHCFSENCGDFVAAVQWSLGVDFQEALRLVAEYLNVTPSKSISRRNGKPPKDPVEAVWWADDRLTELSANHIRRWCESKPPITPAAVKEYDGQYARWPRNNGHPCIAFQGTDLAGKVKAVLLYESSGKPFPEFKSLSERKTHLVGGSQESWITPPGANLAKAKTIIKWEGMTDTLAGYSASMPDGFIGITNACGAGSANPSKLDFSWAKGSDIIVAADADQPGVRGGRLFAVQFVRAGAKSVKLVTPPGYEIAEDHGRDFRDWFLDHSVAEFVEHVDATESVTTEQIDEWEKKSAKAPTPAKAKATITNADVVFGEDDEKTEIFPLPMADVLKTILDATDGWPKRIGGKLFVEDDGEIQWLKKPAALFGYLASKQGVVEWYRNRGCVSKEETCAELARTAEAYETIETMPHEPPIPTHYYACNVPVPGDGSRLERLLDFFCPETPIDRELIRTVFATPLWGGAAGCRPAFLVTATKGRGRGKSKLAQYIAYLWGGYIDISPNEDADKIKTRLLTPSALPLRVAMLDNVKSNRFSWGELEALITASIISGRELYEGNGSRPNLLTWIITLNGASLSTDLAQRVVEIRLADPTYDGTWEERLRGFIDANQQAIIGDLLAFLRSPSKPIKTATRWASWERDILSRVTDPDISLAIIMSRREQMDVEREEGEIVEDYFSSRLRWLGYDPEQVDVFVPSDVATRWFNSAMNDNRKAGAVTRVLKQFHDEERVTRILPTRAGGSGERGFRWVGEFVGASDPTKYDLRRRLNEKIQGRKDSKPSEADF